MVLFVFEMTCQTFDWFFSRKNISLMKKKTISTYFQLNEIVVCSA